MFFTEDSGTEFLFMVTDTTDMQKRAYLYVAADARGFVWPGDVVAMFRYKLISLRANHGPP